MINFYRKEYLLSLKQGMRIFTLILSMHLGFAGILWANVSLAQLVSLKVKQTSVKTIFESLEKQANVSFVYDGMVLKGISTVTIQAKNQPLNRVLQQISDQTLLSFKRSGHFVAVSKTLVVKPAAPVKKISELVQDTARTLYGMIIDSTNSPIPGASVRIKTVNRMSSTDVRGNFKLLDVHATDTLIISSIGFKTRYQVVGSDVFFRSILEEAKNGLDEVVVQGYGRTSQRTTTGNIARVTAKDIETQPVLDPLLTLQGRVAGLEVTPQDGYQGGVMKVEIRGRNVVNRNFTSDPLYVIDGVPLTVLDVGGVRGLPNGSGSVSRGVDPFGMSQAGGQNPLFNLNTADIESIEVLKDADATAIYGSRGANGVILITTKKGKKGNNELGVNIGQGVNFVTRKWDYLNTQQYIAMREEAFRNDGVIPTIANAPDLTKWDRNAYTDWQDYAYGGTGNYTNAQVGLSGGSDQTSFRIAGGFANTSDITTVSGINQKGSAAVNLSNHSINQRFTINLTANYGFSTVNQISLSGLATLAPNAPSAFDDDGNLNYNGWRGGGAFPFSSLLNTYESKSSLLTSNLSLSYTILKGLVFRTSLGYNRTDGNQQRLNPIAAKDPMANPKSTGTASFAKTGANNWIVEPQLEYNGIVGVGRLNILLGGTIQKNTTNALKTDGSGYTSDDLLQAIANAPIIKASNLYGAYRYAGVFARIGYNIDDKYIVNLNGRHDGSSRFGPGNQFGNFGAIGAAWIASQENWLKEALPNAFSLVKLRGSYGITGSDAVGDYQFLSQWGIDASSPMSPYNGVTTLSPLIQPNQNFHWQVNKKLEAALDLGFWDDRINFEVAYYRNRSDNQLITMRTPDFTGFSGVTANSPAKVQNTGYEFLLSTQLVSTKDFSWNTSLNISFNRNKLLDYPDLEHSSYVGQYRIGSPLNMTYVYQFLGVDPWTGQYTYEDYNKDGVVKTVNGVFPGTNGDDRYVQVTTNPKYAGGLANQFVYKSFTLAATFAFKKQIGRNTLSSTAGSLRNLSVSQYENRWQYPGQEALYARLTNTAQQSDNMFSSSTAAYTDASYIRLQNVALAYRMPAKWIHKIGAQNLALNISAQNLFVITKYKGIDPETQSYGAMPPMRTISGGLSCTF